MDSIDAQCLIVDLLDADDAGPDQWRHDSDGSLHFRFSGSPRSFSWPPEAVEDMAARWRDRGSATPETIAPFVAVHADALALVEQAGRGRPDAVLHDMATRELDLVWKDEKLVVVVELDRPEGALRRLEGAP